MAIGRLLHKSSFEPKHIQAMAQAFEAVCAALEMSIWDDDLAQDLAAKVVACARGGERDPSRLCDMVLVELKERPPSYRAALRLRDGLGPFAGLPSLHTGRIKHGPSSHL
jgi:hypothetical protein